MLKDSVFIFEIYHDDFYADLRLPATDYELIDALDKLRLKPGDDPKWSNLYCKSPEYLPGLLEKADSIYEINALAKVLATHDLNADIAFDGLLKAELDKNYGNVSMETIYNLACSVDSSRILDVQTDEELGRFYVENDFVPGLEHVPDALLEYLDYAKIGEKMRQDEGGVFSYAYYVIPAEEQRKKFGSLDLTLKVPDYKILLEMRSKVSDDKIVLLKLPADSTEIENARRGLNANTWRDVSFQCVDCCIPDLKESISYLPDVALANRVALTLAEIPEQSMAEYKAILQAASKTDISELPTFDEMLGDYYFYGNIDSAENYASAKLKEAFPEYDQEKLQNCVRLNSFGQTLAKQDNVIFTHYGALQRTDGQPIIQEDTVEKGLDMRL